MATQEYAASIQGVSIRVTRLDAAGNLLNGPGDSYTTSAFLRVSFTPEYEEGDEITEKGANGVICVSYKAPDTLKRVNMELAICEPDPELSALISGGLLLRKNLGTNADPNYKSVGWAAPGVGDDPAGYGVAIEVWSFAVKDGKRSSTNPYFHWIFPFCRMRQSGDRVIENGLMANTFEGYALGNANFDSGIDGRWEFPVAAERPYAYARTTWAPTGFQGFYTWSDNNTDPIYFTTANAPVTTAVTIASANAVNTVGTVYFSAAHNLVANDVVRIDGVGSAFNSANASLGVTITGVTTGASNSISYTLDNAANVGSTVVAATLTRSARVTVINSVNENPPVQANATAIAVTALPNTSPDNSYNVPGNKLFNADNAIDYVIQSNENL
jgi:hypothetical protein